MSLTCKQDIRFSLKYVVLLFLCSVASVARAETYNVVEPMLTTQWNQNTPYNSKCPLLTKGDSTYTGCYATALAQILTYWQDSAAWKGTHTYAGKTSIYKTSVPASLDLSQYVPDWSNLLNEYKVDSYTKKEADAVGELMFNVGYVMDMVWGRQYSEPQKKVLDLYMSDLLSKEIGFSKKAYVLNSRFYGSEELKSLVIEELSKGRPILCTAFKIGANAGHAFVLDGVNEEGKVHVNWGWGGVSDEYYDLFDMKPLHEGVGSSTGESGYVDGSMFIINICPASKDKDIKKRSYVYLNGHTICDSIEVDCNKSHDTIAAESFSIQPSFFAAQSFNGKYYVRLHNADGAVLSDSSSTEKSHTYNFPKLNDGKYFLTFYAYEDDDDIKEPLYLEKHDVDTIFVERENGKYVFTYPKVEELMKAVAEPIEGFTAYSSNMFKTFKFKMTNQGKSPFHHHSQLKLTYKDKETGEKGNYDLVNTIKMIPDLPTDSSRIITSNFKCSGLSGKTMGQLASEYDDLKIGIYLSGGKTLWEQSVKILPGRPVPAGKQLVEAKYLDKTTVTPDEFMQANVRMKVNADTILSFYCYIKEEEDTWNIMRSNESFYQGDSLNLGNVPMDKSKLVPGSTYTLMLMDLDGKKTYFSQKITIANSSPTSVQTTDLDKRTVEDKVRKVLENDKIVIHSNKRKYNINGINQSN